MPRSKISNAPLMATLKLEEKGKRGDSGTFPAASQGAEPGFKLRQTCGHRSLGWEGARRELAAGTSARRLLTVHALPCSRGPVPTPLRTSHCPGTVCLGVQLVLKGGGHVLPSGMSSAQPRASLGTFSIQAKAAGQVTY